MDTSSAKIAVVGSINLDLVARVKTFPRPGETVTNATLKRHPGGKGGNQALAARRLGARVHMVACVGDDAAADEALKNLKAEGVNLTSVRRLPNESTGTALITVDASGENQIVVAPGANARFQPNLLQMPPVDALIAQLEVPVETLVRAAEGHHGIFCLNAAPAKPVSSRLLDLTDVLVVNELEALALGAKLNDFQGWIATTYGKEGARLHHQGREIARYRPPRVDVTDTVGAGDAFVAALMVAMMSGLDPAQSLKWACAAGALTATRQGAQTSPTLAELRAFVH